MKTIAKLITITIFLFLNKNTVSQNILKINGKLIDYEYEMIINDTVYINFGVFDKEIVINEKDGVVLLHNFDGLFYYISYKYKITYKDIMLIKKDMYKNNYLLTLIYDEDYESFILDNYIENKYIKVSDEEKLKIFKINLKKIFNI
ncbi:MAG: hypothetical protein QXL18_05045 [Candidatus Woesearchaeota archaeon]